MFGSAFPVSDLVNSQFSVHGSRGFNRREFRRRYHVLCSIYRNLELECSNLIILPTDALTALIALDIPNPYQFCIRSRDGSKMTHVGVMEFSADPDSCYVPSWIMKKLGVSDNDFVVLESVRLPLGTYTKLKPRSVEFFSIENPNDVLQVELNRYASLTEGDIIKIKHKEILLDIEITKCQPAKAISVIDTDLAVDFERQPEFDELIESKGKIPDAGPRFPGEGARVDGGSQTILQRQEAKKLSEERFQFGAKPWLRSLRGGVISEKPLGFKN